MLKIVALGLVLVGITFATHAVGSTRWMELLLKRFADRDGDWKSGTTTRILICTGIFLLMLHVLEATTWAVAYWMIPDSPQIQSFGDALYFSVVTFTTLGYGDITLDPPWRALSGIEALNGILLAGWSTALLFTVVQRSWSLTHTPKPKS